MSQPLHIKGAQIWDGDTTVERDLYVKNGRIVSEKPNHAVTVNLEGYTLFPGLINAHDHLELNHFPRTKFREVYDNAHQWGEDVNARLNDEPFKTLRSYPLWDRVFIGGLKNLLCGATTVVHHGPPHKPMYRKDFPVRVLKNYGWAHSLHFNTEEEIIRSYQNTPKEWSWFIHLAEGIDDDAENEYFKLQQMSCTTSKTVAVHGIGFPEPNREWTPYKLGGIVWCPTTNKFLHGIKRNMHTEFHWHTIVQLGSDSRLTAEGDLLDELRFVHQNFPEISCEDLWHLTGFYSLTYLDPDLLEVFNMSSVFKSVYAWFADFFAIRNVENPIEELCNTNRAGLACVFMTGIPQIGEPDMMARFSYIETVACTLDGVEKRMNVELARQVHRCTLKEQGLEVDALPQGKRFIFF